MRLTAKSSRGFNGPGGLTASCMRLVKGCSSLLVSHFFANLSDKSVTSKNERLHKNVLTIVNMLKTCTCICRAIRWSLGSFWL